MKNVLTTIAILVALAAGFVGVHLSGGTHVERRLPEAPPTPAASASEPCAPHGIPADVCALCRPELVPEFQAKGDWCAGHNRPESQCYT